MTSLAALVAITMLGMKVEMLAWVGRYSMAIFLYHALVLAAFTPYIAAAPAAPAFALLSVMMLSISLPILFEMVITRKFAALLPITLGQKAQEKNHS